MARMKGLLLGLSIGLFASMMNLFIFGQASGGVQKTSDEKAAPDRSADNPMKATPKSIESGKKLFSEKCEMCHGEKADGKGDMAAVLEKKPANLTDAQGAGKLSDKQVFDILTKGKDTMPKFGDLPESDRWNLVNFIRSVEAKPASGTQSDPPKKN